MVSGLGSKTVTLSTRVVKLPRLTDNGPLAQMAEQGTFNPKV